MQNKDSSQMAPLVDAADRKGSPTSTCWGSVDTHPQGRLLHHVYSCLDDWAGRRLCDALRGAGDEAGPQFGHADAGRIVVLGLRRLRQHPAARRGAFGRAGRSGGGRSASAGCLRAGAAGGGERALSAQLGGRGARGRAAGTPARAVRDNGRDQHAPGGTTSSTFVIGRGNGARGDTAVDAGGHRRSQPERRSRSRTGAAQVAGEQS